MIKNIAFSFVKLGHKPITSESSSWVATDERSLAHNDNEVLLIFYKAGGEWQ